MSFKIKSSYRLLFVLTWLMVIFTFVLVIFLWPVSLQFLNPLFQNYFIKYKHCIRRIHQDFVIYQDIKQFQQLLYEKIFHRCPDTSKKRINIWLRFYSIWNVTRDNYIFYIWLILSQEQVVKKIKFYTISNVTVLLTFILQS